MIPFLLSIILDRKSCKSYYCIDMYYSKLLGKTQREFPHDVRLPAHGLLIQSGFIRPLGQGLFSLLPLGIRVVEKLKAIIREEMEKLGGQEVRVPLVNPAEIWKRSGRYEWIHKELVRFKDRHGHELVLSPTHEEAMIELVRKSLSSYKELPILLYEFQLKFRDEEKPRGGLLRAKEFLMKDAYSFHRSYYELNNFFPKMFAAYSNIFKRCGVKVIPAEAGVGFIGGEKAYEFLMPSQYGDDVVIECEKCNYLANRNIANSGKEYHSEQEKPLEKIKTPLCVTMEDLAHFTGLPKSKLAKSVVYSTGAGLVMAVVRGDYEVSEEKLQKVIDAPVFELADNDLLQEKGLIPGFVSPIGLDSEIRVIVDDLVRDSSNLVYGANEKDYHYLNGNFGRDYSTEEVFDIAVAREADICLQCGGKLKEIKALEVGHIFKLGDRYSRELELFFQNENGKKGYAHIGCYGIGMGRLIHAIVESNRDEKGMVWPATVAPYLYYLMSIGKSRTVRETTENIYRAIEETTLYDDRDESPGVKFKDSDLLGIPIRIIVSSRNIEKGLIEIQSRKTGEIRLVEKDSVLEALKRFSDEVMKL